MYDPVPLYTRSGGYVTTVSVPPMTPPAEILAWGSRVFVRRPNGDYVEGIMWWVHHHVDEPGAGDRPDPTMAQEMGRETITVNVFWPGEGYGIPDRVETLDQAHAAARRMAAMGYGANSTATKPNEIHIVRTTREVTVWHGQSPGDTAA